MCDDQTYIDFTLPDTDIQSKMTPGDGVSGPTYTFYGPFYTDVHVVFSLVEYYLYSAVLLLQKA